jgi:hypothetical protein
MDRGGHKSSKVNNRQSVLSVTTDKERLRVLDCVLIRAVPPQTAAAAAVVVVVLVSVLPTICVLLHTATALEYPRVAFCCPYTQHQRYCD